ncbi:hypothetical protein AB0L63_12860 [Nocardia sp. NPDC051990]|uniref:hypothetical protein n=1 Tax=Nocardia sp. NPDC051990 TaxID=3155285 RepID=UPI0034311B74
MTETARSDAMRGGGRGWAGEFASTSLSRHLVRGAIGFGAVIGSFALMPVLGLASLLLLPVGLVALRGCPTCWAIGLLQTLSHGRLQRSCTDGTCQLVTTKSGAT